MTVKTVRIRALRSDSVREEAGYIPGSLHDVARLRALLTEAGQPPQIVSGITGWLVAKWAGEEDQTSGTTRATYRRILAELDAADDGEAKRSVAA